MARTYGSDASRLAARFLAEESGATAIEYSLIAAGVGVTVLSTIFSVGSELKKNWYDKLANMF